MKYHKQRYRHDPENGVYGDCHRTALACVLNKELDEVPHFFADGVSVQEAFDRERAWLRTQGLAAFTVPMAGDQPLEIVLTMTKGTNSQLCVLLVGESMRGTNHVVVAHNGEIIHDPHPDGGGLVGPCDDGMYYYEVLVPLVCELAP